MRKVSPRRPNIANPLSSQQSRDSRNGCAAVGIFVDCSHLGKGRQLWFASSGIRADFLLAATIRAQDEHVADSHGGAGSPKAGPHHEEGVGHR